MTVRPDVAIIPISNATSHDLGCHSEAMAIARMIGKGWNVLMPFARNARYDFAVERNGEFQRIQVKTGRIENGAIGFPS